MRANPYESPTVSRTARKEDSERDQKGERVLAWWLACAGVGVTGLATFGIWSAARLFQDYVDLEMPHLFSPGVGWCYAGAWVVAFLATFALAGKPRLRSIALFVISAYFAAVILLVLTFLSGIWSPTWSLS